MVYMILYNIASGKNDCIFYNVVVTKYRINPFYSDNNNNTTTTFINDSS